jgi:NAD(P)-dependent dehydrogenase (short-subunit alcohol dehydrogenase family)
MGDRLKDKVCIITGSGGSMGRAAAIKFAAEGALVVGCDINEELEAGTREAVAAIGGKMVSDQARDLTDPDECGRLVDFAISSHGRLDVLYNNAAGGRFNWVDKLTPDEWRATMREELDIVFFMCRVAWPHLKERGGSIINCASMSGKIGFRPLPQIAHAAAKAGVHGMTRQLAVEGGPFGIRANTVSPGLIDTNKTHGLIADPVWREAMVSRIILGRPGKPEEVASAAVFLASDESSFITGSDIGIDGGNTAW